MVNIPPQRKTEDTIWFGIGCFHFGYEKPLPYTFRRHEYARELKVALESIPAVTDVNIDLPVNDLDPQKIGVGEAPPDLNEGQGHFPPLSVCWINFQVYIPARVQQELAGKFAADETGTENFIVFLQYAYEGPVSYVLLRDSAPGDREPSTAVRVVRLFLDRELDTAKTPIRFQSLGPSPFHADCSLSLIAPAASGKGQFVVNHVHRHGYDALQFTSDHPEYDSAIEALQGLFSELNHELGFFYWINATEAQSIRGWSEIQDQIETLLEQTEKQGVWHRLLTKLKRSRLLHDVFTSLIGFDVSRTFMLNDREQSCRQTYASSAGFIRSFVDTEMADAVQFPTKQITTLVGFLEQRRSKAVELLIVLIAAVVGGIAGAMISHLPTPHLPSLHLPHVQFHQTQPAMPPPSPRQSQNQGPVAHPLLSASPRQP
jgi:hypothetical protein